VGSAGSGAALSYVGVAEIGKRQSATLASLTQRLRNLPVLPAAVAKLVRLDPKRDGYFDEVTRIVGSDPGLTTKLLAYANSAYNASRTRITRIRDAIVRIGPEQIVNLVIAASATAVFVPKTPWQKSLWLHSLTTASIARRLAVPPPRSLVDGEERYLAGLVHDIGRFILYLEAPEALAAIDETDGESPAGLIAAELRICGYTHAELGYLAARKWGLPDEISQFIRHHHQRPRPGADPRVVALVEGNQLADWVSMTLLKVDDWRTLEYPLLRTALSRAPIAPAYWSDRVLTDVRVAMDAAYALAAALGV